MTFLSVSSSLVLTILMLALSYKTNSAPTQHLTFGVQGNTPTLIVTSSEFGITPQTMSSTTKKFDKVDYNEKISKNSNNSKKLLKAKLDKNQSVFPKKDKLQYLAKPLTKLRESSVQAVESLENTNNFSINLKRDSNATFKLKSTTGFPFTDVNTENTETYNTNLPLTTSPSKVLIASSTAQVNKAQPQEISTLITEDTSTTTLLIKDDNNLNISIAMSTTLSPKELKDIITTINYKDDSNIADIITNVSNETQTETNANDGVLQIQKTTQYLPTTTHAIKIANVNDDDSHESIDTTENENLLLATTETSTFNTPHFTNAAAISTPTLVTLVTDNAKATTASELQALSLAMTTTMTTTENVVNDNSSNKRKIKQTATAQVKKGDIQGPLLKEIQKLNGNETKETKSTYDELKSTEIIPLNKIEETTQEPLLNKKSEKLPQNKIETKTKTKPAKTILTTQATFLTTAPQQQQTFSSIKTNQNDKETTTTITSPEDAKKLNTAVTTEGVLKLIDLEKHVLKQPLLIITDQHDNGHDGLKTIKKKQLIDKHYVEALLHNKQDGHHSKENPAENEKYLPQTTASSFSTPLNHSTAAASNRSLLKPIKRGYLGPILMEEKTFHVVHHVDTGRNDKEQHVHSIETQLRKGHFVELKAKQESLETEKFDQRKMKVFKNKNEDSSVGSGYKNFTEMQSDQPAQSSNKENIKNSNKNLLSSLKNATEIKDGFLKIPATLLTSNREHKNHNKTQYLDEQFKPTNDSPISNTSKPVEDPIPIILATTSKRFMKNSSKQVTPMQQSNHATVLSTTVFQVMDSVATKTPIMQADTLFTSEDKEKPLAVKAARTESKISDIQIEVYDSTVDSIVSSTNFKDIERKPQPHQTENDENYMGKTTKPPIAAIQQERFTQYVIDRTETSTHEPINYSTIQLASGKPEPAAIEIHINVSESIGNESEDSEFSFPQTEFSNKYNNNEKMVEVQYDERKSNDNIKLEIPSNANASGMELSNNEILVVEIIDTDNNTELGKAKNTDELFITDVKNVYTTPPPPPPPPPFRTNFDRDSDTIFYISNTEVKVGESLPATKSANEERKLKLESQFFPANYMASTHTSSLNKDDNSNPTHHLYEEDIILSPSRNQADSLKIYRNNNEPSPPLDVTYVGESIIEVEQSPDTIVTTTYVPDQQQIVMATPQADVIIQPAILPEISIGVPVIGELPPQIELKEIDFMPNEAQFHRSGIYDDNDNSNSNSNNNNNDLDDNSINGSNNNHDVDVVSGNGNSNQHIDESSIQYGGDLIDESADGGFDGVEGSYPFGNPAAVGKSSSSSSYSSNFLPRLRKQQQHEQQQQQQQQQPNHVADYAHLYVNYGVNNMRKDELSADVKDSGEMFLIGRSGSGSGSGNANEQNVSSFRDLLNKVSISNSTIPFMSANSTQNERMSNATAFSVMENVNDLDDKSTEDIINLISLAIGLFIVILPVVVTCSMFWALRYLYKKYHSNLTDTGGYADQMETKSPLNEDGVEKGEFVHETSSSPINSHKDTIEDCPDTSNKPSTADSNFNFSSEKSTSYLETSSFEPNTMTANFLNATACIKNKTLGLSLALSSSTAQKKIKPPPSASSPREHVENNVHDNAEYKENGDSASDSDGRVGCGDNDNIEMPGPNGSITKMTLENNLLIVETEERNDISRVARETKMDYNKDGVFVVEVARGIDSKRIPESPITEGNEKQFSMFEVKQNNGGLGYKMTNEKNCVNNERVQIHSPPTENPEEGPRSLHQIEEVDEPLNSPNFNENNDTTANLAYKANTGLSQSDLSTTSSNDSNKGYCYGNQELYTADQKGYSKVTPTRNVVLKCDVKDIKDDDGNPENDHYLKKSPNKKEELSKDKEDIVKTIGKSEGGDCRHKSGESPEQKQNEKISETTDDAIKLLENEESDSKLIGEETVEKQLENCNNDHKSNDVAETELAKEIVEQTQKFPMPIKIEVHITPAQGEGALEDKIVFPNKSELPAEIHSETEPSVSENIHGINEKKEITGNNEIEKIVVTDKEVSESDMNSIIIKDEQEHCVTSNIELVDKLMKNPVLKTETVQVKENELEQMQEELIPQVEDERLECLKTNGFLETKKQDPEGHQTTGVIENDSMPDKKVIFNINGSANMTDVELVEGENTFNSQHEVNNGNGTQEIPLTNGITTLSDLVNEPKTQQLQNGHAEADHINNALNDIENGYDSIMSLPEPPPTTEEQLSCELSEQQLDSLPPPPPPEIFNLKDLPTSLSNGNADFPQAEDSNNFCNTLPPPPPTTIQVNGSADTTNGKLHASPLTPPASPPAHFTNNLHAGLCSQPIAVDVNGS